MLVNTPRDKSWYHLLLASVRFIKDDSGYSKRSDKEVILEEASNIVYPCFSFAQKTSSKYDERIERVLTWLGKTNFGSFMMMYWTPS